jgi:putative membrane protein
MKKKLKKITALSLSLVLACSLSIPASGAVTKDESAYLFLNPDGSVNHQTVSSWLHSDGGLRGIEDRTSLSDLINLKNPGELPINGGSLTWDSEEQDVYYQGSTDQIPPITAAITYELDGKVLSAEELLGKSGHVRITIRLTNHETQPVYLNGTSRFVATPFASAVIAALPSEGFTNVKIEKGTIQTDSQTQLACGLALPGMAESFDGLLTGELSELQNYLLDEVVLEADATDFSMPTILIACFPIRPEEDGKSLDFDSLFSDLDQLSDASGELLDGTKELDTSLVTLKDKMGEFSTQYLLFQNGLSTASGGSKELAEGTKQLESGISALQSGADTLAAGAGTLSFKLQNDLVPGIQAATQLQAQLQTKMDTLKKTAANLAFPDTASLAGKLSASVGEVFDGAASAGAEAGVSASKEASKQAASAALEQALAALPEAQRAQVISIVGDAIDQNVDASLIAGKVTEAMTPAKEDAQKQAASSLIGIDLSTPDGLLNQFSEIEALSGQLMQGVSALTGALYNAEQPSDPATVAGAVSALSAGANQLSQGAEQSLQGAKQVSGAAAQLSDGLSQLSASSQSVAAAISEFEKAAGQLSDGATELHSGMQKFQDEGISKLTESETLENLRSCSEVFSAMREQASNYLSYTGAPNGVQSDVKFIMKVQAPEKPQTEDASVQPEQEAKPGFWQRVKDLFTGWF